MGGANEVNESVVSGQRSSVKVTQNAKGERTFEAKVYEGTTTDELDGMVSKVADTMEKLIARAGH
jgi:hypothetical protein